MRAYEVKKFTGKSLFEFIKKTKSKFNKNDFKKVFINFPRELLHKQIEKRVDRMFKEGAIYEVIKFNKMKVKKELSSNKIIGIKEINDYLKKKIVYQVIFLNQQSDEGQKTPPQLSKVKTSCLKFYLE